MRNPGRLPRAGHGSGFRKWWRRWVGGFALGLILLAVFAWGTPAEARRVALVIGNNAYTHIGRLEKAEGDADAVSETLRALGFDRVRVLLNARRWAMRQAVRVFAEGLSPGDIAFVFFSGHGLRINGHNYLLARDTPYIPPRKITEETIRLYGLWVDELREKIQKAGARLTILVLDACRNNPYRGGDKRLRAPAPPKPRTRSYPGRDEVLDRGLARRRDRDGRARGVFILYSAGIDEKALDALHVGERNRNSVFTRVLIRWMRKPGLALPDLAEGVSDEVAALARRIGHAQRPAYYDEMTGDFYFRTPQPPAGTSGTGGQAGRAGTARAVELAFWNAVKDNKRPAELESYLKGYPNGAFAALAKLRLAALNQRQRPLTKKRPLAKQVQIRRLGITVRMADDGNGVIITRIKRGSLGARIGLEVGDNLTSIGTVWPLAFTYIRKPQDLDRRLESILGGQEEDSRVSLAIANKGGFVLFNRAGRL